MASKSTELIFQNRYICQCEVKQGAFGVVYQGFDLTEKRPIALKLEKDKKSHTTSSLTNEARILSKLKGLKGVPTLFWSGKKQGSDERALVMSYLGKDLQYHITKQKSFSLKTVIMAGVQLIKVLQAVHERGVVHRDIKPDNILTAYNEDEDNIMKTLKDKGDLGQLYLCDFGISKIYRENNKHIDYKINKPFIGTIRFASEAAHKGYEISRKDDLESLGYVLVFLFKGKLPWQNIDKALGNLRKDRVGVCKQIEHLMEYFYDMPEEFLQYFKYVKGLTFKENPNYDYLVKLFQDLAKKRAINVEDYMWDWRKKGKSSNVSSFTFVNNNASNNNNNNNIVNVSNNKNGSLSKKGPILEETKKNEDSLKKKLEKEEKSKKNLIKTINSKPKINIKKNYDYSSDEEGKRKKSSRIENFQEKNLMLLGGESDIFNGNHEILQESHDKEVYFNSKSLISSNIETNESSVLIKNKDFTTLKYNVYDQEENGDFY